MCKLSNKKSKKVKKIVNGVVLAVLAGVMAIARLTHVMETEEIVSVLAFGVSIATMLGTTLQRRIDEAGKLSFYVETTVEGVALIMTNSGKSAIDIKEVHIKSELISEEDEKTPDDLKQAEKYGRRVIIRNTIVKKIDKTNVMCGTLIQGGRTVYLIADIDKIRDAKIDEIRLNITGKYRRLTKIEQINEEVTYKYGDSSISKLTEKDYLADIAYQLTDSKFIAEKIGRELCRIREIYEEINGVRYGRVSLHGFEMRCEVLGDSEVSVKTYMDRTEDNRVVGKTKETVSDYTLNRPMRIELRCWVDKNECSDVVGAKLVPIGEIWTDFKMEVRKDSGEMVEYIDGESWIECNGIGRRYKIERVTGVNNYINAEKLLVIGVTLTRELNELEKELLSKEFKEPYKPVNRKIIDQIYNTNNI